MLLETPIPSTQFGAGLWNWNKLWPWGTVVSCFCCILLSIIVSSFPYLLLLVSFAYLLSVCLSFFLCSLFSYTHTYIYIYTGCLLGLGTKSRSFTLIRNPFLLQVDEFGPKHLFWQSFSMSLGGVLLEPLFLFYAILPHTFQDFELAAFKTFLSRCLRFSLECLFFMLFGGLTPIDWTGKPLLQSFKFGSFSVIFSLKGVYLK